MVGYQVKVSFFLSLVFIFLGSSSGSFNSVNLIAGQSVILSFDQISRVAVGDEQIADILVLSPKELLINAHKVGITSLHVWDQGKQQRLQLRVFLDDGTLITELLTQIGLHEELWAYFIGQHLVLDGMVQDKENYERAERIARAYSTSVVNLLRYPERETPQVVPPLPPIEAISKVLPASIEVNLYGKTIFLEGFVENEWEKKRAMAIARAFYDSVLDFLEIVLVEEVEEEEAGVLELEVNETVRVGPRFSLELLALWQGAYPFVEDGDIEPLDALLEPKESEKEGVPLWEEKDELFVEVLAVEDVDPLCEALHLLQGELPYGVNARGFYGHLILEGLVGNEFEQERAYRLASVFGIPLLGFIEVKREEIPVILVEDPIEQEERRQRVLLEEVREAINVDTLSFSFAGNTLFLEGVVPDSFTKERAGAIAKAYTSQVVDLIRVKEPMVISLPEEIEEISLTQYQEELLIDVRRALREPSVEVMFYGTTLVLEGEIETIERKARVESIVSLFYEPVLSFLTLPKPPSMLDVLASTLGLETVEVYPVGDKILLRGTVFDQATHTRVIEIAKAYGEVVDHLHVLHEAQVLLQVMILEVDHSAASNLGIEWGSLAQGVFTQGVLQFAGVGPSVNPLAIEVEALTKEGRASLLAAPHLLTLSGMEASFLVGGEIPVMNPLTMDVEWKDYGIMLRVTPYVLLDSVRVSVHPEVSSLDWDNGQDGLPALKTRRLSTTVRMQEGSTLVLGGLLHKEDFTYTTKVPFLGDLPIIGPLFTSTQKRERHTELVILLTPWILYGGGEH